MILYINKPNYEEIKLKWSNKPPLVLFHTGSLYFTVRNSYVLNLQPKETRKSAVHCNADCEVTGSSQEVSLTSSKEKSSSGSQSSDNTQTVPFQGDSIKDFTCVRGLTEELPDGPRDTFVGNVSYTTWSSKENHMGVQKPPEHMGATENKKHKGAKTSMRTWDPASACSFCSNAFANDSHHEARRHKSHSLQSTDN